MVNDAGSDLGQGAGFDQWHRSVLGAANRFWYQVTRDLPECDFTPFAPDADRQALTGHSMSGHGAKCCGKPCPPPAAITGHSMGGHGALTIAMTPPERYRGVLALAPVAHPTVPDRGRRQVTADLGPDEATWAGQDTTLLMGIGGSAGPVLPDQGSTGPFPDLLLPEALAAAAVQRRQAVTLRIKARHDHSSFLVASFMPDHVACHTGERGA